MKVVLNILRIGWLFIWDYIDLIWDACVVYIFISTVINYLTTTNGKLWMLIVLLVAGPVYFIWIIPRDVRRHIREEQKKAEQRKTK
jgi:hypothetical protein